MQAVAHPLGLGGLTARGGYLHTGLGSQLAHGIDELAALRLHHEGDGVTVLATAKAVKGSIVDVEAGRLLVMERAASLPVGTGARQLHPPSDQSGQRGPGAQLLQKAGRQSHLRRRAGISQSARHGTYPAQHHARPSTRPLPYPCPSRWQHRSGRWLLQRPLAWRPRSSAGAGNLR